MVVATPERKTWRSSRGKRLRGIAAGFLLLSLLFALGFRGLLFQGNFGVVDPGRAYRSAQPTTGLALLLQERRLGSVLNLRGGSPRDSWYANEVRACRAAGVDFYDLSLSATARPGRRDLLQLIDVFQQCRYPLLIHCKSGSDRTGLASALYRMVVLGQGPRQALASFAIAYGHVPLFGTQRLHEPINEYQAWLVAKGLTHSPERFRDWVAQDYHSVDPTTEPPPLEPGTRVPLYEHLLFP